MRCWFKERERERIKEKKEVEIREKETDREKSFSFSVFLSPYVLYVLNSNNKIFGHIVFLVNFGHLTFPISNELTSTSNSG